MDPKKLKGVVDYPIPQNPTDVHAFLGLYGYYQYFIPQFSKIACPLLDLTKKSEKWHWDEPQFKAFETLKTLMCTASVLKQPNFEKSSISKLTHRHMAWEPYSFFFVFFFFFFFFFCGFSR